jgi:hypothetical protein
MLTHLLIIVGAMNLLGVEFQNEICQWNHKMADVGKSRMTKKLKNMTNWKVFKITN